MRNVYIENNDYNQAFKNYVKQFSLSITRELIDVSNSCGRITAEPLYALCCDPVYNCSAMDGIAVLSDNTRLARDNNPITLEIDKHYKYVNTGNAIEGNYDSVIMIEDVIINQEGKATIIAPSYPWQNVRVIGESIVKGELILPSLRKIRPQDIGALLSGGHKRIQVIKKPIVSIIPTGNEMVESIENLKKGCFIESNSKVLAAMTAECGGEAVCLPIASDEREDIKRAILNALNKSDIVIVNAGSSAGSKDYVFSVISEIGKVITHGLSIKPGKPTILGIVQGKPVIGIPGYPVSAYNVYELVVKRLINMYYKLPERECNTVKATLTRRITSSFKSEEYIRMSCGKVNNMLVATPLERGAAQIMSLVKADGILKVDRLSEGIESGQRVDIRLLKPLSEIENTLVITGSNDMIIDIVSDKMSISSAHVGSLAGVNAISRGECHIAPVHIIDEISGEYNIPYIKKHFKSGEMAIIKGVGRLQGLIIDKNNPYSIKSIRDIADKNVVYANRQRGAGTRLFLDYLLDKENINSSLIKGYDKEYNTHLSVAIAVKNGIAATGMGVLSACNIMELDFIPQGEESYDFLVRRESLRDNRIIEFINIIKSDYFILALNKIGGYTYKDIGKITIVE